MNDLEKLKSRTEQAPQNELFRFSYAKALMDDGKESDAISHLEFCFQKKPDWMVVVILLGKIFWKKGEISKAREYFQKSLELAVSQKHESPEAEVREILRVMENESL